MMSALYITALRVWKREKKFHHLKKSNAVKSEEILSKAQAGGSKQLIAALPAWGTLWS